MSEILEKNKDLILYLEKKFAEYGITEYPEPEADPEIDRARAEAEAALAEASTPAERMKATRALDALPKLPPKRYSLNFAKPYVRLSSQEFSLELAQMLRDDTDLDFDFLSCISGVDYDDHMEVVYQFYSINLDQYLMLKVSTDRDKPSIISLASIWPTADWHEREAYDLLGIEFTGHPNMTRILLADDWQGHPLRKDYTFDKKLMGLD